jgi:5'-3' exonuclease
VASAPYSEPLPAPVLAARHLPCLALVPSPASPRLLLDSPSLFYRAFFALPVSIRDPKGRSTNAVHGYLDMTSTLLRDRQPGGLVHAFDVDWRPAWRVAAYAAYKSQRRPDPPELPPQLDVIRAVLDAAGMQCAGCDGYEADDVLATIAAEATPDNIVEVVTGDRDLLQLVRDPEVAVLFTVRGVSQLARFDEAAVRAKYGVGPQQYADFAILRGDPSDGLPGIRGIGEKTASRLIARYGSLDALMAERVSQPAQIAAALRHGTEYIAAMRTVVPVCVTTAYTLTPLRKPDVTRLDELAAEHGVRGPVTRLLAALGGPPLP